MHESFNTLDAYYASFLIKLYRQQYNVHSRYAKHLAALCIKKAAQYNFRKNLQLQPYFTVMYPSYQTMKGVYLKDTLFQAHLANITDLKSTSVLKKHFTPKLIGSVKGLSYPNKFYGGLNYIFKPFVYKYGKIPRATYLGASLNDNFKGSASLKNIIVFNKYNYASLNSFFFFFSVEYFFFTNGGGV